MMGNSAFVPYGELGELATTIFDLDDALIADFLRVIYHHDTLTKLTLIKLKQERKRVRERESILRESSRDGELYHSLTFRPIIRMYVVITTK